MSSIPEDLPTNLTTTQDPSFTELSTDLGDYDDDGRIEIKIGYLASVSRDSIKRFAMRIGGAMTAAVRDLNNDPNLLPGYKVSFVWTDTGANDLESISALTQQWKDGVVAFFGPNPTCTNEARIAAAWNLPMLSAVSANNHSFLGV